MRSFIALALTVVMLAGLGLQLRTYARAEPQEKARMRPWLALQAVGVAVLTVLNLTTAFS